jgi:NAD(P)-dependent dehydrogenase (short-subunit alcohol dehydrogenase family)
MGLAAARRFLEEGARLVVTGREEGGWRVVEELAGGDRVKFVLGDVQEAGFGDRLMVAAVEWLGGRLDVLFHVAGISGRRFGDGALHECTDEGWQVVMEVNARGVFETNRAAARVMRGQAVDGHGLRGTVLNMGSVVARAPSPRYFGTVGYAASKGAIESLTLAAAAAYAGEKIRFNVIAPGLVDTPMAQRAVRDPEILRYVVGKQPLAGGAGLPEDVAEVALALCEPATRLVTGQVVRVDGGWSVSEGEGRLEGEIEAGDCGAK